MDYWHGSGSLAGAEGLVGERIEYGTGDDVKTKISALVASVTGGGKLVVIRDECLLIFVCYGLFDFL